MKHKIITALLVASLSVPATIATAEETDASARLAEVEAQIDELKAERRELRHQLDNMPVYKDDNVRVWFDGVGDPSYDWYSVGINITIENKTENSIEVMADEVSVDGFMVDASFVSDISPNKKARTTIDIEDPSFTVDNTKNIELKLMHYVEGTIDFIRTDVFELD